MSITIWYRNSQPLRIGPDILGLTEEKNGTFTYQVLFYAENGEQVSLQRTFLAAYIAALKSAGIHVITPPLNLQAGSVIDLIRVCLLINPSI